jgi:hypothetical protein
MEKNPIKCQHTSNKIQGIISLLVAVRTANLTYRLLNLMMFSFGSQAMETLSTWLELYKCFHQAAIQNVSTLGLNEVCEAVAMKICQALVRHCPTSANQAVPLLKAAQNIIMLIPFSDICGTQQSSKCKSRYLVLPGNYALNVGVAGSRLP